jgi:hypothetical protein
MMQVPSPLVRMLASSGTLIEQRRASETGPLRERNSGLQGSARGAHTAQPPWNLACRLTIWHADCVMFNGRVDGGCHGGDSRLDVRRVVPEGLPTGPAPCHRRRGYAVRNCGRGSSSSAARVAVAQTTNWRVGFASTPTGTDVWLVEPRANQMTVSGACRGARVLKVAEYECHIATHSWASAKDSRWQDSHQADPQ